ncbi:fumarate hydratase [Pseudothermotoga thermarum]|uniref:Hydro-lyase, Fe-S type, tartrate/fumarate subfamily, alpha subunit n=1 Tax=Pseudothermotoga thermarum DSM 5069 TaxID=688269 RepID=F7YW15_9THEM|nr:fumarate hydratase [Pseudothermotoga thermarum]AEH50502.1 hydro-lyase, Fe-S type, tartrate/fumarate subfamily, alpha subunit [Pseudothermotoga thermarum DSM 5069]
MKIYTFDPEILKKKLYFELVRANTNVDNIVLQHLESYDGPFADVLKKNVFVARETGLPLCQDTGMVEFFVFFGPNVFLQDIVALLNQVVREVYLENPFRYGVVRDPLFKRQNTGDNTPCIVHLIQWEKQSMQVRFLIKGGGSENLSRLFMLSPSADKNELVEKIVQHIAENGWNACPPLKIGIGIGGSAEEAVLLSKIALTRDGSSQDEQYAQLEREIFEKVNDLCIGYQGLGKGISCYSVNIEYAPTHIATLPVAISVDCYLCRKGILDVELFEFECG